MSFIRPHSSAEKVPVNEPRTPRTPRTPTNKSSAFRFISTEPPVSAIITGTLSISKRNSSLPMPPLPLLANTTEIHSPRIINGEQLFPLSNASIALSLKDTLNLNEQKDFTIYVILVRKEGETRNWTVQRRYREFHTLRKNKRFSSNKSISFEFDMTSNVESTAENTIFIPPIPPKLFFNNMKEENIQKRIVGLQGFLDGVCSQSNFLRTDLVRDFLQLDKKRQNLMYQIPDEIYSSIFRFLTLREIFPNLLHVTKWWKDIIYNSFRNVVISHVKNHVFFGHTLINIDVVPELVLFVRLFSNLRILSLSRIYELQDSDLELILEGCPLLEQITLNGCYQLINPKLRLHRNIDQSPIPFFTTKIALPYCVSLTGIEFVGTLLENLLTLDLTGTMLTDEQLLALSISQFKNLKKLILSEMKLLKAPRISSQSLRVLWLRHCTGVLSLMIECPQLIELNLGRTQVTDESLRVGVLERRTCVNLEKLWLDMCDSLLRPNLTQRKVQLDDDSFVILSKLELLNIEGCSNISELIASSDRLTKVLMRLCPLLTSL